MTKAAHRYSVREPSEETFTCPACKGPYHATSHNQKYCTVKCYQYARQFTHDPSMPKRIKSEFELRYCDRPLGSTMRLERSLERRRKAKEAKERAQKALERELANWPTCKPRYTGELKTAQNWHTELGESM